jgi:hypothetical protein
VNAKNIAKWNGSTWSALGSGVNGGVIAIAVSGNDVYAGGWFASAGGVSANNIAKWEDSSWSALGSGMYSSVYAIAVNGSDAYVGGYFTTAGRKASSRFAIYHGVPVGVSNELYKNNRFELLQNYPNPFNPSTVISYQLAVNSRVSLKIYNMLGQEVRTLVKGYETAGYKQVRWDGKDHAGNSVSSGVYIYRLETGQFVQSKKMVLIR